VPGGGGCFRPANKGRRETKEIAALPERAPLALDNDQRFGTVVKPTAAVWLVAAVGPCASKTQAKAQGCFTGCRFWEL
jgi:hypothetical protein